MMPTAVGRLKLGPKTSAIEFGILSVTEIHPSDSGIRLRTNKTQNAGTEPNASTQRQP
jgi:hypothetical protein